MRLREFIVERITVIKSGVDDRGSISSVICIKVVKRKGRDKSAERGSVHDEE